MMRRILGGAAAAAVIVAGLGVGLAVRSASRGTVPVHVEPRPVAAPAARLRPVRSVDPAASYRGATLRLEGQVVAPDGAGVAGAHVAIDTRPPRVVTAELDGSFAFEPLVAGRYVVTASTDALIGGPVEVRLAPASAPVVVAMVDGAALVVNVVDERGGSVAGARIELAGAAAALASTDAAGHARLAPVRPGEVDAVVSARGFAPGNARATLVAGAASAVTVALHAGHVVSGRVLDERGAAVAGAKVTPVDGVDGVARTQAVTDAAGGFALADLGAGALTLTANDGEHAPAFSSPLMIADHDLAGITLTMAAGGVLRGRVLDVDGQAVSNASIRVSGHDRRTQTTVNRELTSDPDGRFEVRGLPRLALQAQAEAETAASDAVDVDLRATASATVELRLDAGGTIAGVVVAPDGEGAAEVQVSAFAVAGSATGGSAASSPSVATTDAGGAFVLHGLRAGMRYGLSVRGQAAGLRNPETPTLATTGARDVRLALIAGGGLRGRITLRGPGAPPAHATVQVGHAPPVTVTGDAFELTELVPGRYEVTVRGELAARVIAGVVVEAGRVTDLGVVEVDRGRTLTGQVIDERGLPVAGAQVSLVDAGAPVVSDAQGRFAIASLAPGTARVIASHATRGQSEAVAVEAGSRDPAPVSLVLGGTGSLAGTVTVAGRARADIAIEVVPAIAGAAPRSAQTDDRGAFAIADLPVGSYRVSATQPTSTTSQVSATTSASVAAGARTVVSLEITPGTVELAVRLGPMPSPGAQVLLFHGDAIAQDAAELARAFADGRAAGAAPWPDAGQPSVKFVALTPDRYSLCAAAPSSSVSCRPVVVAASPASQTVELR